VRAEGVYCWWHTAVLCASIPVKFEHFRADVHAKLRSTADQQHCRIYLNPDLAWLCMRAIKHYLTYLYLDDVGMIGPDETHRDHVTATAKSQSLPT
jgi:hypothetical protein